MEMLRGSMFGSGTPIPPDDLRYLDVIQSYCLNCAIFVEDYLVVGR